MPRRAVGRFAPRVPPAAVGVGTATGHQRYASSGGGRVDQADSRR